VYKFDTSSADNALFITIGEFISQSKYLQLKFHALPNFNQFEVTVVGVPKLVVNKLTQSKYIVIVQAIALFTHTTKYQTQLVNVSVGLHTFQFIFRYIVLSVNITKL